jgi:hypothetical protein
MMVCSIHRKRSLRRHYPVRFSRSTALAILSARLVRAPDTSATLAGKEGVTELMQVTGDGSSYGDTSEPSARSPNICALSRRPTRPTSCRNKSCRLVHHMCLATPLL